MNSRIISKNKKFKNKDKNILSDKLIELIKRKEIEEKARDFVNDMFFENGWGKVEVIF